MSIHNNPHECEKCGEVESISSEETFDGSDTIVSDVKCLSCGETWKCYYNFSMKECPPGLDVVKTDKRDWGPVGHPILDAFINCDIEFMDTEQDEFEYVARAIVNGVCVSVRMMHGHCTINYHSVVSGSGDTIIVGHDVNRNLSEVLTAIRKARATYGV